MFSYALKMPDGTVCHTGPNCKRHGNKNMTLLAQVNNQIEQAKQKVPNFTNMNELFPKFKTRKGLNTSNPGWAEEFYQETVILKQNLTSFNHDTITKYRGMSFKYVNAFLRDGVEGLKTAEDGVFFNGKSKEITRIQNFIKNMDDCFKYEKTWVKPRLVYRAVSLENEHLTDQTVTEFVKSKHPIGSVIEDKAYMSVSADPDFMVYYGSKARKHHKPYVVYEILSKKGLPIAAKPTGDSLQNYEREILINRDTKFKVVNIQDSITFIHTHDKTRRDDWGHINISRYVMNLPAKANFTVIQLEQI